MRNILLGIVAGLAMGTLGTYAYEHYLGDGAALAQSQADLASANENLARTAKDSEHLKNETDVISAQVQQLSTRNDDLKHQLDDLKKATAEPDATASAANPMSGFMKAAMDQQREQRLLLLKSRLNLTPEQEAAVKAAMDKEGEMAAKMFQGGKINPQAFKDAGDTKTVDQTLNDILAPDQKTEYQQMKADEQKSNAETMATIQLNQIAPALQLSESQKDQVASTLYQLQLHSQNPDTIKQMAANSSDPAAILDQQAQAKEDALSKILTPDQMAIYHQQLQGELQMQKAMMQKFPPPAGAAPASAPAPAPAP